MAFKGKAGICLRHACTIVDYLNGCAATVHHKDLDLGSTCINGILHKFLDDRGRTLHYLSRCYLIGNRIWE